MSEMLKGASANEIDSFSKTIAKTLGGPVDVEHLEGIGKRQAHQLRLCGIADVQNMATANPILLFLQTSFGIYEILDWIQQAILIVWVGAERAILLRSLGVRTAFDLSQMRAVSPDSDVAGKLAQILDLGTGSDLYTAIRLMEDDLSFQRTSGLANSPLISAVLEAANSIKYDLPNMRYQQLTVFQRFSDQSPLIFPLSILTMIGAGIEFWSNFGHVAQLVVGLAFPSVFAQATSSGVTMQSQSLRPVIACFLGAGIFMTLGVCLYSGFLAKKPSAKAAEAVKSILSFSFGIVTSSLSGL